MGALQITSAALSAGTIGLVVMTARYSRRAARARSQAALLLTTSRRR